MINFREFVEYLTLLTTSVIGFKLSIILRCILWKSGTAFLLFNCLAVEGDGLGITLPLGQASELRGGWDLACFAAVVCGVPMLIPSEGTAFEIDGLYEW